MGRGGEGRGGIGNQMPVENLTREAGKGKKAGSSGAREKVRREEKVKGRKQKVDKKDADDRMFSESLQGVLDKALEETRNENRLEEEE